MPNETPALVVATPAPTNKIADNIIFFMFF